MPDLDFNKPGDRMMACMGMSDLTPCERIVMAALAYHDGNGGCHPSMERLAGCAGMNRFTVNNHINGLVEKGRVVKQGGKTVNRYALHYGPSL